MSPFRHTLHLSQEHPCLPPIFISLFPNIWLIHFSPPSLGKPPFLLRSPLIQIFNIHGKINKCSWRREAVWPGSQKEHGDLVPRRNMQHTEVSGKHRRSRCESKKQASKQTKNPWIMVLLMLQQGQADASHWASGGFRSTSVYTGQLVTEARRRSQVS